LLILIFFRSHISFGVFTDEDMRRLSHTQIVNTELYQPQQKKPFPYGVLDPHLGTSSRSSLCETCGLDIKECVGHFGYIHFELPVFHIGYLKNIIEILQRICKSCAKILLLPSETASYLRRFRNPNLEVLVRKKLYKDIGEKCKKVAKCPHCNDINGAVKKVAVLKLVHEKYKSKAKETEELREEFHKGFDEALHYNNDLRPYISKAQEDLNPLRVLELFREIPESDVELLDMDPRVTRPEQLVMTHMLVPPLCIRPSVASDLNTTEDDLSTTMSRIIHLNGLIQDLIKKGQGVDTLMDQWDQLQAEAALYINSEQPGIQAKATSKTLRSLCQRLKGKYGRFRGNLSGKRVDFSGRTVISPDCNLELYQVGIPELQAKVLTYPERVSRYNIDRLRALVRNGPEVHPGANYLIPADQPNMKKFLKFGNRDDVAKNLKIGDIVERHLMDGDYVLFNRQPSLHRLSIMCHVARILPYRTLRFNPIDCAPYNADFDGDEMNIHVPQTEEARAEAANLMGLLHNLVTPRNGEPVIACNQDFLTAAWKLSRKNMFFDRSEFCMLCSYMGIEDRKIDLPPPTILKPIEMWTGKQLFSLLIKPNKETEVFVNLETAAKNYSEKGEHLCINDGYVCFRNSYLISGNLDKKLLGGDSKVSLFYFLMRNYGVAYAAACMARVARVGSRWLMNHGFSIGIDDVMPSDRVTRKKAELLERGYKVCEDYIKQFQEGKLEPQPGCNADQTLEVILNKELSDIRTEAGNMCLGELHFLNAPLTMAVCGSKGSVINISQMVACVGQQAVNGSRIQNGFINRTLPHFPLFSRKPDAKGFVQNSFFTGLLPTEFFFHTMAGREGLVDTAVKTAETGYMQRRLMKALEDLSTQYDNSVRNSGGYVVQFQYGDDLLDPIHMEATEGKPINFGLLLTHIKHINAPLPDEEGLETDKILDRVNKYFEYYLSEEANDINDDRYFYFSNNGSEKSDDRVYSHRFVELLIEFVKNFCIKLDKTRELMAQKVEDRDDWMAMVEKMDKLTQRQLDAFLKECKKKYLQAITEPGQTVGALAAQSIGEPGTQMTLKTFHFAGVASMNVTLGVPRIVEIINATKNINTPIITAELDIAKGDEKSNEIAARIIKGRIEKTTLGQIADVIEEVYDIGICYISIELDYERIKALQLDINEQTVVQSILSSPKLGIKEKFVQIDNKRRICVYPLKPEREHKYFAMQYLKQVLPNVIVSGVHTISRAVINKKKGGGLNLLVEGTNLLAVMGTSGVDGTRTTTNNILEMVDVLGIEAARHTIMSEIHFIMTSYSMSIDQRHMKLLSDVMTSKGEILGITRFGIGKMRESTLMLASFERTTDHLFDAAVHSRVDSVEGVSECIIMGIPIGVGTGLFKLMQKVNQKKQIRERQPLFLNFTKPTQ
jgi:DNA-directed RNA polymerase III subunit RPC1